MAKNKAVKVKDAGPAPEFPSVSKPTKPKFRRLGFILVLIILAAVLLWKFKTLLVVAMVNGRPVTRMELESKIMARYGKPTLEEIISERLITEKAQTDKVVVTPAELDAKIAELTQMLAGRVTLEEALAQQGMSLEEFRRQVYLRLLVEKIAEPQVKISDQEVADYMEKNKTFMTATEEAAIKQEALTSLKNQKISEIFQKIFADLKSSAQVINLLNAN